jgi:hypothetical protein
MLAVIAAGLAVPHMLRMRGMFGVRCNRGRLRLMLTMTLVGMGLGRGLSRDRTSERERDRCNEHRLHVIPPDEMAWASAARLLIRTVVEGGARRQD